MLSQVLLPNGDEWTYRYDAFARRVEKRGPKERVEFVWDGDVVLHEIHVKEEMEELPILWEFEPYGFAPISKFEHGKQFLCINNVNGAPQELRTIDGIAVWLHSQTVSGQERSSYSSGVDCPIRFQGQWFDRETGFHYNRFRYYVPFACGFLSQDPSGLIGGLNLFAYVPNSNNWIDPYGLSNEECSRAKSNSDTGREDTEHDSYDKAIAAARIKAGDLGNDTLKMYDPKTGTLIGEQSIDQKRGWRIDNDHLNWWDWSGGKKGSGGKYGHEFFPTNQAGPHSEHIGYAPWEGSQ